MNSVGSHGSSSLPFVMKVMVCHFVSNSHEVMTALIVMLPLIVVVEISLQLHRSSLLQYKVEWNPGVRDYMVLLIKWLCKDHSLCTVYCYSKKVNFVKEGARPLWFFWSKKELPTAWWSVSPFSYLWRFQHAHSEYGCPWLCSCCPCFFLLSRDC